VVTLTTIADFGKLKVEWRMRGGRGGVKSALEIFESQSWAFCDYLWHVKGTKNRKALITYMKKELRGKSGPKEFQRTLFGRGSPRWTNLEERWRKWVAEL
jgi:hypothetical protein